LPRASTSCPQCQSSNVVYHQEPTRFVYTCTHCDHVFH
jgi:DNA-directed RNA polymerase subunit M/transcription elongation factor TFIIS